MGLHRVEVNIRPENAPSLRVVEKLGFRDEGLRERYLHIGSTWCDQVPIGEGPLYAVSEIAQVAERTTSDGRRLVRVNYQTRFTNTSGVLVGTATGTSIHVGSVE